MSSGVLGKKLGMTSVFSSEGFLIPVTVIKAGPCVITQIKTRETDGYNALQIGFGDKKASRINKPAKGHFKKSGGNGFACLREFRIESPENYRPGQAVSLEIFKIGERVDVTGASKGEGLPEPSRDTDRIGVRKLMEAIAFESLDPSDQAPGRPGWLRARRCPGIMEMKNGRFKIWRSLTSGRMNI
jgi:hypothetical protein